MLVRLNSLIHTLHFSSPCVLLSSSCSCASHLTRGWGQNKKTAANRQSDVTLTIWLPTPHADKYILSSPSYSAGSPSRSWPTEKPSHPPSSLFLFACVSPS